MHRPHSINRKLAGKEVKTVINAGTAALLCFNATEPGQNTGESKVAQRPAPGENKPRFCAILQNSIGERNMAKPRPSGANASGERNEGPNPVAESNGFKRPFFRHKAEKSADGADQGAELKLRGKVQEPDKSSGAEAGEGKNYLVILPAMNLVIPAATATDTTENAGVSGELAASLQLDAEAAVLPNVGYPGEKTSGLIPNSVNHVADSAGGESFLEAPETGDGNMVLTTVVNSAEPVKEIQTVMATEAGFSVGIAEATMQEPGETGLREAGILGDEFLNTDDRVVLRQSNTQIFAESPEITSFSDDDAADKSVVPEAQETVMTTAVDENAFPKTAETENESFESDPGETQGEPQGEPQIRQDEIVSWQVVSAESRSFATVTREAAGSRFSDVMPAREIINQVAEKVKIVLSSGKSEMVIDLKPDQFGRLALRVVTEGNRVSASFIAENRQVKEVLDSNMQFLKDSLEKQGFALEGFSVSVGNGSTGQAADSQRAMHTQGRSRTSAGAVMNPVGISELSEKVESLYAFYGSTVNIKV